MYGPAVRRKRFRRSGGFAVLHQCIRPLIGACCAPGHHGYQRACVLISREASNGPNGPPGFACARKTGPPFRFILSQTSAEKRGLRHRSLPDRFSSFVRAMRLFLCPGLQSLQGIARRGRQGWPSRLAFRKHRCLQATPCMRPFKSSAISQHSSLSSSQFLCSTWNPVSSPRPTRVGSRRAQGLSGPAVALRRPLFDRFQAEP